MKFNRSRKLYNEALNLMPGGVSSPVRAFKPHPFFVKKAKGSKIYDVDGNEFIDYCMAYGALILGHANDEVRFEIEKKLREGWIYGTPIELEIKYAKLIRKYYPSIEMLRFVNTGSEATMSALRLARGFTGKEKIVKVEGSFHGSHDSVLVKAGSGATTFGVPNSAGIPIDFVKKTLQVPFNDLELLSDVLEKNEDVSAVIMEPVMGNSSLIIPDKDYLREVRKITQEKDVLLIFDEIITGFRIAMGGAQEYYGVKADITTLGKIAGGGFPIGIYGSKKEIMERVAPSGDVYQAGTFSGNPISLLAGYTTLKILEKRGIVNKVAKKAEKLCEALKDSLKRVEVAQIASMFCIYFGKSPKNYSEALKLDKEAYMKFFWRLIEKKVFFPPSQFEVCFMSDSHSEEDIEKTFNAIIEAYETQNWYQG
ncbi:MAG: glutamate-1-semialdehyde 2,1-aminomutase [Archaeoglobaceae archaeon]|nr:glutamate-1-semialdehyde 2,1-aminomutase [Archaeoglobaceae archaeon]MDW7989279.1 glutamate-1-semialdehyde 2,1-aminomutase [Archaeoglobaceae archaeon]